MPPPSILGGRKPPVELEPKLNYDDVFDFLEAECDHDGTMDFVRSLKQWYSEHGSLTQKQHESLVKILERNNYAFDPNVVSDASVAQSEERPIHIREAGGAIPPAGSSHGFDEYQQQSRESAQYPGLGKNYVFPALGLCIKAGRIANLARKIAWSKNGNVDSVDRERVKRNLGDVLWYISQIASEFGMKFSDVAITNLHRIRARQEGKLQDDDD